MSRQRVASHVSIPQEPDRDCSAGAVSYLDLAFVPLHMRHTADETSRFANPYGSSRCDRGRSAASAHRRRSAPPRPAAPAETAPSALQPPYASHRPRNDDRHRRGPRMVAGPNARGQHTRPAQRPGGRVGTRPPLGRVRRRDRAELVRTSPTPRRWNSQRRHSARTGHGGARAAIGCRARRSHRSGRRTSHRWCRIRCRTRAPGNPAGVS